MLIGTVLLCIGIGTGYVWRVKDRIGRNAEEQW